MYKALILILILIISAVASSQERTYNQYGKYVEKGFDPLSKPNFLRCGNTGGLMFESPYYSVVQLYTVFEKKYKECGDFKTSVKGNLNTKRKFIKDEAIKMSNDEECPEFNFISNLYLNKHQSTMSRQQQEKVKLLKGLKEDIASSQIQVDNSYLAWGNILCSSGQHSYELLDRLDYIRDIEDLKFEVPPVVIEKNGQVVEDCHNVSASGGVEGLKEFFIDITAASSESAVISYNTFTVPDNVKVFDDKGNTLIESGCIGTSTNEARIIPLDKSKFTKIKIEVDALCKEKKGGTAWQLHFSCGPRESKEDLPPKEIVRRRSCRKKADIAVKNLKENVEFTLEVQRGQWARAVCQKQHYGKVVKDYTGFERMVSPQVSGNFERLNFELEAEKLNFKSRLGFKNVKMNAFKSEKGLKNKINIKNKRTKNKTNKSISELIQDNDLELEKILAEIKSMDPKTKKDYIPPEFDESKRSVYELLGQDVPEEDSRDLASVPPVTRHEITPFVYGYDDFVKRKDKYCPSRPEENESLFKHVSYVYCRHAYPRLFGIEDDD